MEQRSFVVRAFNEPVRRYQITENMRVRLRSSGTLGRRNDTTIDEIAGKVGKLDLHVLRVQNSQATILATFSDEPEEAVVPTIFLVPNELSEEDELKANKEAGSLIKLRVVT